MRTDIYERPTQFDALEKKFAAKATILMRQDSVVIKLNSDWDYEEPAIECPHSLEKRLSSEKDLCEKCPNNDFCLYRFNEVRAWPLSPSNISSPIKLSSPVELLNNAYTCVSNAIAESNINTVDDVTRIALENYQNDFTFLSVLLNFLSSDRGRNLKYNKYKEILSGSPHWISHDEKVNLEMLSPLESYNFHSNNLVAIWNDTTQYEQYIDWVINQEDCFAAYTCNNLVELCFAVLDYYVSQGINIKRCKICNKFFVPQKDYRQVYCSETCLKKFESIRINFKRKSDCYRAYERIRDMLRKRREQAFSSQSEAEIFDAENAAAELWESLKIDMAAGRITEGEAIARLRDFRENLKK